MIAKLLHTIVLTALAAAATQATQPATQPNSAPSAGKPAQQALSPEINALLDTMEAAGKKYRSIAADVEYTEVEIIFSERTTYTGKVYYKQDADDKQPAWFRIHFDKVKAGAVTTKEDRDYVFLTDSKGQWFITRNARTKQYIQHHIARPGEQVNPLKIDQGRFPLPFGQTKADVVELFNVSTRKTKANEPRKTSYLKLTPKPGSGEKLKVSFIELWVGADGLPVQIRTEDVGGEVRQTATFRSIEKKAKLEEKIFKLPKPRIGSGWEVRIEPLPE